MEKQEQNMTQQTIKVIDTELEYQKTKGASVEKDANQSLGDFLVYTQEYLDKAKSSYCGFPIDEAHKNAVKAYVKVGALVAAYLESHGA